MKINLQTTAGLKVAIEGDKTEVLATLALFPNAEPDAGIHLGSDGPIEISKMDDRHICNSWLKAFRAHIKNLEAWTEQIHLLLYPTNGTPIQKHKAMLLILAGAPLFTNKAAGALLSEVIFRMTGKNYV